jgi:hypothetical protein
MLRPIRSGRAQRCDAVAYRDAFHEQLAMPLRPSNVEELHWYFQARRRPPKGPHERFDQPARVFDTPRFRALYRAWCDWVSRFSTPRYRRVPDFRQNVSALILTTT